MDEQLLVEHLRNAVAAGEIWPALQPQVDLRTRQIIGFEVLARWSSPTLGPVPPVRFIPVAERAGLLDGLILHLIRQACAQVSAWPGDFHLAFNLAPTQFLHLDIVEQVSAAARAGGLALQRLCIEITESSLFHSNTTAQRAIALFKQAGMRLALDAAAGPALRRDQDRRQLRARAGIRSQQPEDRDRRPGPGPEPGRARGGRGHRERTAGRDPGAHGLRARPGLPVGRAAGRTAGAAGAGAARQLLRAGPSAGHLAVPALPPARIAVPGCARGPGLPRRAVARGQRQRAHRRDAGVGRGAGDGAPAPTAASTTWARPGSGRP